MRKSLGSNPGGTTKIVKSNALTKIINIKIKNIFIMIETFICSYCGKECKNSNSLRNHERLCKENPNRQMTGWEKYSETHKDIKMVAWNKGLSKETDERIRNYVNTIKQKYESGEIIPHWTGKKHTEEEKLKISKSRKKYLEEHPDKVPYKLNHYTKQSYPEQYFEELFNNDEILKKCKKEYPVGLYRLDFAFPDIKFYIEIDGEQHYVDKRIVEHDKNRTEVLNDLGWKCFRIRWAEYKKMKFEEKQLVINEIKNIISEH